MQQQNSLLWKQPEVHVWQQALGPTATGNFCMRCVTSACGKPGVVPTPVVMGLMELIASFKKWKQKAKTFDSLQGRKNNFKSSA